MTSTANAKSSLKDTPSSVSDMRITLVFLFLLMAANLGLSLADWVESNQLKRMEAMCNANPTLCK